MDYGKLLNYFPWANAVYGKNDANPAPIPVGNSAPIVVDGFKGTPGSGFDGALYKDPGTGKYTLAFAGSVQLGPDWLGADPTLAAQRISAVVGEWAGSWHPQMSDALSFAYAAVKQIAKDLREEGRRDVTMDDIRARLDVTGHSLGGALAEMVSKFFGIKGANIDGPGVSTLVGLSPFTQMQDKVAADSELSGFQRNYKLEAGDFTANAFSIVGVIGTHLDGTNFAAESKASVSFYAGSTLIVGGGWTGGMTTMAGLGVLANSVTDHPMGAILGKIESALNLPATGALPSIDSVGLGNAPLGGLGEAPALELFYKTPGATTYAIAVKWVAETQAANVAAGLSPSGLELNGTAVTRGGYTVIAFRDDSTGRVNEVYTPLAGGAPVKREFVIGQDGSIGTFTIDGKLQFLMKAEQGQLALAELQADNNILVSNFTASGVVQEKLFKADADTADGLRSGRMDLKQPLQEISEALENASENKLGTPTGPVGYETVIYNGNTYTVSPRGTLDRAIQGHSDWTESRDSTGGGVIMDGQGNTVAQLQPGDRVSMMDDGRIVVNDLDGKVVNRVVDEAAGEGFYTSAPPIAQPPTNSQDPTDPGSAGAVNGSDHQSDNYLNVIDIPAPALANHFAGGNAGGAYGAGTLGGFDVLPLNGSASFLVNEDGDIAGEINRLPNGDLQIKNLYGEAVYVNQAGAVLSEQDYQQAQQAQQDAQTQAQWSQAAGAIGLMNSIIGLQNWEGMGDLQRLAAVTSIYNVLDNMSGGNALPGNLGTAASVLGLLNALDQGNVGGIAYSGLSLVEHLTFDAATKMGFVTETFGGNFMPGLGLVLALDSGDPLSIASAALAFVPGWGQAAAIFLSIAGRMFESDIPMKEGQAHAQWDEAGNTQVITDQDAEGGGATATGWMNSIVTGLQAQLAATQDAAGNSYALIPNLLPAIGYQYDADGFNYGSPGHMYLKWTDENGQSQTRYYDGAGNREDGTGDTLAGDFMAHAQAAIAPAWQVATVLAHWQQGQGITLPEQQASLPQELSDGIHQTLQALSLELPNPATLTNSLIDIDADGYLEQTQWLAANQQVLAIDADGDNQIGAGELLHLSGGAALNSLGWLDADGNKVLNASDPAFGALRLWIDIASDGNSQGETQSLSQAGITAIDFGSNPPAVMRSDGSRTDLTAQTLTGDVLGVRYTATVGGVLESKERGETVLHAVNTRLFDGQAGRSSVFALARCLEARYQSDSCLRKNNKGYRKILCMNWRRKPTRQTDWSYVN